MRITVDTSALLSVCCNEASKSKLIVLTIGHQLIAPPSVHWEMGNALSAMLRRDRIRLQDARSCLDEYHKIKIQWMDIDLSGALEISAQFKMYAYDAYLLACAQQSKTPILSLDRALKAAAVQLGIPVLEV